MRKKLLPVLLTLALAVALLTVGALADAEEPGPGEGVTVEDPNINYIYVQQDGVPVESGSGTKNDPYKSLDYAVAEADEGSVIWLLSDCDMDTGFNKTLTFTGNGKITIDSQLMSDGEGWMCFGLYDPSRVLTFTGAGLSVDWSANGDTKWLMLSLSGKLEVNDSAKFEMHVDSLGASNRNAIYLNAGAEINVSDNAFFAIYGVGTEGKPGQGLQLDQAGRSEVNVTGHSTFLIDGTNRGYVNSPTIYVEDSTFTVQNCTANASNGGKFTAVGSEINFVNNAVNGLSAGELVLASSETTGKGSVLTCDDNGGYGIAADRVEIDGSSRVYVRDNATMSGFAGFMIRDYGLIEDGAEVVVTGNQCKGLYLLRSTCEVTIQEGVDLIITDNFDATYGGGIRNQGKSLILPSDAIIYNNHAGSAGDDIYCSTETTSISFGTAGTDWRLDGEPDCNHHIDGWYDDSEGARWVAHPLDGNDPHTVVFDEFSDGIATIGGGTYLKAAHGLLDADVDTVTITPADIIVYTGGDSYEGSINDEEQIEAGNGLPTPGYFITLPDWVDEEYFEGSGTAADLTGRVRFVLDSDDDGLLTTEDEGDRIWELDWYTDENIGSSTSIGGVQRFVYRMDADSLHNIPVRIQFTDEEGNTVISDDFTINLNDLYKTYRMTIYPGELNQESIKAQILDDDGTVLETLDVKVSENATLTIRGTTNAEIITGVGSGESDVAANTDVVNNDGGGAVTAIAPSGTEYYINESLVAVDPENVSLITDAVVETEPLRDYIVENDLAGRGENYVYRYLDLVDDTNGRAWVMATEDIEVYWSLPEGSSPTDNFRVIHFQGLDRQYDDLDAALAGNDPVIYSSANNNLSVVEIDGEYYLRFAVDTFSPFVLVWDTDGGDEPVIPPVRPTDPVRPQEPEGLNTEDHVAYIIGYPDGEVKPEGNITRAEVATIFFRLLTDETREEYWSQTNGYTDVARDAWYNNAISTLSNLGIIDGYEDGSFRPNSPITRAEFTKIAVSFFEYADIEYEGTFSDVAEGRWYTQFVAAAVEMGLIEGYPDGTFRPEASITRAEACTIVNRTLGRAPHEDHLLPEEEMITWPDNLYGAWYYADMQEATNSHDYEWTTEDSERVEDWTEKLPERDWDALEEIWSEANDAPGGEVIG